MRRWSKEPRRISVVEGRAAASLARALTIVSCFIYKNETTKGRFCQYLPEHFFSNLVCKKPRWALPRATDGGAGAMANAAMEQGTAEDLGGGEEGGGEFGAGAVNRFIDSSIRMKSQRGRHDPQQRNIVKSLHSNGLRVSDRN